MQLTIAGEWFREARIAAGYSENTLVVYLWALTRLAEYLGDPEIENISRPELDRFMLHLRTTYIPNRPGGDKSPLSGSSLENAWKAIRSFFNWSSKEFSFDRPDNELARPKYTTAPIKPFLDTELITLLKACDRTAPAQTSKRTAFTMQRPTARRDKALVLLLLDTGLRASEVARLRIGDVSIKTGEVFVQPWGSGQKTKSRYVYLGRTSRLAVMRYLADRQGEDAGRRLFVTEDGNPMDRSSIRLILNALGKRADVKGVHPHRFRHTFAIQFLRNNGDVFSLQRILGHSTLDMCRRYINLANDDAANAHRCASPVDRWQLKI
jgi:integrase/recombinase XerD